jgi:tetratricopeptide (TPR) repeat protein
LKKTLELNPNNFEAYSAIGQLYAQTRRLAEALTHFEQLAQREPKAIGAHTTVAVLLEMQNRRAEAKAKYAQILALNPHAAIAANNLAWMHVEDGTNLDEALQLAQRAKAELPDVPEVNDTIGWVYHKRGLSHLAIPYLNHSIEKDSDNALYHFHLGLAYLGVGDLDNGRQSLERALALKLSPANAAEAQKALQR